LPANMLVVALIPLAMLLSLLAGLAGMFATALAGWFAWPAQILLTYMLDTAHLLAEVPGIFRQHIGLSIWQLIGLYALIPILTFVLTHKAKRARPVISTEVEKSRTGSLDKLEMTPSPATVNVLK